MADTTPSAADHLIIKIPFPGFYESALSSDEDNAESYEASSLAQRDQAEIPDELCLDEDEYIEAIYDCTDYRALRKSISKGYIDEFGNYVAEQCDYQLNLEFEKMESPKEYNFNTDRSFAYIPKSVVWDIFAKVDRARLAEVVRDRHSSAPGFISFYSSDIEDWIAKPLMTWDHNELETLLIAFLIQSGVAMDDLTYAVTSRLDINHLLGEHLDWPKLEAKVAEKRDEKRAQYPEGHVFKDKPCKHTADMFGGSHA